MHNVIKTSQACLFSFNGVGAINNIANINTLRARNKLLYVFLCKKTSSGILTLQVVSVNNVMKTNKMGQGDRNNFLGIKVKVV